MAAYFHGSAEIQPGEGLPTLYLLNPNCLPYSDTSNTTQTLTNNDTFFHRTTAGNAVNTITQPHAPPPITSPPPPFMGIPLPGAPATVATVTTTTLNEISTLHGMDPKLRPNMWGSLDTSQIVSQQALSLTLSTQQQQQQQQRGYGDVHVPASMSLLAGASADKFRVVGNNSLGSVSNPVSVVLLSSKYLGAAQEILDEVVKLEREIGTHLPDGSGKEKMKLNKASSSASASAAGEMLTGDEKRADSGAAELTPVQRQEIQVKKAKLISMLDEVEQKYRQYHGQMQLVITSFEQAAGFGSAKSYTALALQTISKQFRALKDAISAQIKLASKSLGDEIEGPRLRYVDNHFRQQRALHQLGMVQHNAWRPQRGLPERAVSVLRAWLFEHFLHPYPKDSDKHMLAKQTGLTRGQVSNWFINARVRLWKPMVEEMYLEEIKNQEEEGTSHSPTTNSEKPLNMKQTSTQNASKSISSENGLFEVDKLDKFANLDIPLSSGIERNGIISQPTPKRPFTCSSPSPSSILSMDMDTKPPIRDQTTRAHQLSGGNFGVYSSFTPEVLRSYGNSNVSLTLGLPCETTTSLSPTQQSFMSNHHQGFHLGRRFDMGDGEANLYELGRTSNYEAIDFTQSRKRFAAQLLSDYVT